jgi:hypothetical protein
MPTNPAPERCRPLTDEELAHLAEQSAVHCKDQDEASRLQSMSSGRYRAALSAALADRGFRTVARCFSCEERPDAVTCQSQACDQGACDE